MTAVGRLCEVANGSFGERDCRDEAQLTLSSFSHGQPEKIAKIEMSFGLRNQ